MSKSCLTGPGEDPPVAPLTLWIPLQKPPWGLQADFLALHFIRKKQDRVHKFNQFVKYMPEWSSTGPGRSTPPSRRSSTPPERQVDAWVSREPGPIFIPRAAAQPQLRRQCRRSAPPPGTRAAGPPATVPPHRRPPCYSPRRGPLRR